MRSYLIGLSVAVAAVLSACGGGGGEPVVSAPTESAPPPATDPIASWPGKVMLGTWTGTMKRVASSGSCPTKEAVDRPQSLTFSSEDGIGYTVTATPLLDGILADRMGANWTGEPSFSWGDFGSTHGPTYTWNFVVVAPDQAEISYDFNSGGLGHPCVIESWTGVLTRK